MSTENTRSVYYVEPAQTDDGRWSMLEIDAETDEITAEYSYATQDAAMSAYIMLTADDPKP